MIYFLTNIQSTRSGRPVGCYNEPEIKKMQLDFGELCLDLRYWCNI